MLLSRHFDEPLAQASWLVGCQATGTAIVIDPNRDVQACLDAAQADGLRITHVTETHIHADFVSGARELAQRAGAELLLSAEGGDDWQYAFRGEPNVRLIRDGDTIAVGNVRLDVRHTPGHTPEHLCFVLTDTPAGPQPMGVFTGDFLFVGDVGRPDLLERAAKVAGTMEAGAHALFASLQRFKSLPDWLQVWPGHGAGSACGKALGAVPSSTLGYEKLVNWGLATTDEEAFVREVLAGQPEPPAYFAEMKRINRDGPPPLGTLPVPRPLPAFALADALAGGAAVLDLRPAAAFAAHHVPGTTCLPYSRSFSTYAGSVVPFGSAVYLLAADASGDQVRRAARDLALIGYDRLVGAFGTDALEAWVAAGGPMGSIRQYTPRDAAAVVGSTHAVLVDVRTRREFAEGHLPAALNIPLAELVARVAEVPRDRPLVVQCQGGTRSAIAASVLRARGAKAVGNLEGGIDAWRAAGLPVE
ncbi:MAG: MBL fold metallo-hydrolase [Gemmatimonadetes bacterium]|nr:MBL fold metallo-hydrolase [Gemmatimonadota bacterium]